MQGYRAIQQCTSPAQGVMLHTTYQQYPKEQKKNMPPLIANSLEEGEKTSNNMVIMYTKINIPYEEVGFFPNFNQSQMFS